MIKHAGINQIINNKTMQKIKLINLFSIFLGLFLFGACEYATIQPDIPPPPPPGDSTSYSLEVQPIFNAKCVICHKGSTAPDLREGYSYASLMKEAMVVPFKPNESILYTCLQAGGSMASYGNAANNATIKYWIEEGAKNN
jgi:hypothetical protein